MNVGSWDEVVYESPERFFDLVIARKFPSSSKSREEKFEGVWGGVRMSKADVDLEASSAFSCCLG